MSVMDDQEDQFWEKAVSLYGEYPITRHDGTLRQPNRSESSVVLGRVDGARAVVSLRDSEAFRLGTVTWPSQGEALFEPPFVAPD